MPDNTGNHDRGPGTPDAAPVVPATGTSPAPGEREIRDPRALRALTHPARLRLLEELLTGGPSTATQLADRVGESPANCSWHLRQLARYGWVEEAGGGTGRQRPWRLVPVSHGWGREDSDPELNVAGDAASALLLDHEVAALRHWEQHRRGEPAAWRHAAFINQSIAWLTADELTALHDQLAAWADLYLKRLDPRSAPPGARPVRLVAWGIPARPPTVTAPVPSTPDGGAGDA